MTMITFGDSFSNVQEKRPVPKGTYDLTIESADTHVSKESGKPSLKVVTVIEGHDDSPKITAYYGLPHDEDDADKTANKMRQIKRLLVTFSVPYEDTGFSVEDFFGAKASCELGLTDPDDDQNGNVYNRIILPRLPDESSVLSKSAGTKKS